MGAGSSGGNSLRSVPDVEKLIRCMARPIHHLHTLLKYVRSRMRHYISERELDVDSARNSASPLLVSTAGYSDHAGTLKASLVGPIVPY
jgi:hypothetical protein